MAVWVRIEAIKTYWWRNNHLINDAGDTVRVVAICLEQAVPLCSQPPNGTRANIINDHCTEQWGTVRYVTGPGTTQCLLDGPLCIGKKSVRSRHCRARTLVNAPNLSDDLPVDGQCSRQSEATSGQQMSSAPLARGDHSVA